MLPFLHRTNKQAGILILFFRNFFPVPVTCLSGRWARGDGRSVITLWTKKQKSMNGPNLEKLWLHFILLCFKKSSIHLNVFQKNNQKYEKTLYVVSQVLSLQRQSYFLFQKWHNCSFSLGKRMMKQHWLCNDRSLLTFPSNSNWEALFAKGTAKNRYKATCRIGNTAAPTRILLFDTFANAELLFTEHLSPVKDTVVSSQRLHRLMNSWEEWIQHSSFHRKERSRKRIQCTFDELNLIKSKWSCTEKATSKTTKNPLEQRLVAMFYRSGLL